MVANAETKQLKENCRASAVIEQDSIQQHHGNPVDPVKEKQLHGDHKKFTKNQINTEEREVWI